MNYGKVHYACVIYGEKECVEKFLWRWTHGCCDVSTLHYKTNQPTQLAFLLLFPEMNKIWRKNPFSHKLKRRVDRTFAFRHFGASAFRVSNSRLTHIRVWVFGAGWQIWNDIGIAKRGGGGIMGFSRGLK